MRVLVTGGCGFIGQHLVRALVARGMDVRVLDAVAAHTVVAQPGVSFSQHTVTNYDACLRAMRGVHLVYHLAARDDWSPAIQHPARIFSTNTRGTVEVLTAARATGVQKVILASSWEVYGNVMPSVEDMPCNPITPVGASKLAAEIAGRLYTQIGLDVVILRLFEVWGEGGNSAVEAFAAGRREIEGDGTQTRDFVHIDDVVAALCRAYQWDAGIYNLGSGVETAVLGLYRLLRTDEPIFIPPRQNLITRSCADLERVEDLWRAQHMLEGVT